MGRIRDRSGQGTVEYVGLVALLALALLGTLAAVGPAVPGGGLARAIAERIVCAVDDGCEPGARPAGAVERAYGLELASQVREHVPRIGFEDDDFVSLPIDFRSCRRRSCADTIEVGAVASSQTGEPATAFVHVVDCRDPTAPEAYDCGGERAGRLYLQYWLYYPDSNTRPLPGGFHVDDWESYQVRIDPDGTVLSRASSHHSYNGSRAGLRSALSDAGISRRRAWELVNGALHVAAGSHAGLTGRQDGAGERFIRRRDLRVLPLERIARRGDRWSFDVSPPWRKRVWSDPESDST